MKHYNRVCHEPVEITDPFQDDLWLISLKPQLASLVCHEGKRELSMLY
jgi:hypothetical protein